VLEEQPLAEIEEFFANLGFRLMLHSTQPPRPTPDDLRGMKSVVRSAYRTLEAQPPPYWVDLLGIGGTTDVQWYGSGSSPEMAIRRAAARWRVEQGT
jgi:hypothetical protein